MVTKLHRASRSTTEMKTPVPRQWYVYDHLLSPNLGVVRFFSQPGSEMPNALVHSALRAKSFRFLLCCLQCDGRQYSAYLGGCQILAITPGCGGLTTSSTHRDWAGSQPHDCPALTMTNSTNQGWFTTEKPPPSGIHSVHDWVRIIPFIARACTASRVIPRRRVCLPQ